MPFKRFATTLFTLLFTCVPLPAENFKPNIVIILADDLGYSDLGAWGSEIETPHIDSLANNGLRFSKFRNTGRCCPSRASLLTGRYQHTVGMGWMTAVDEHRPGYRGQLSHKFPTIAETLKENGYGTYIAGKWHLTVDGNFNHSETPRPNGSWPTERGFDHFYGQLSGGGSYQRSNRLIDDTGLVPYEQLPNDWYYTDAISQASADFVKNHDFDSAPLFLYSAHYAPHRPLQAPKDRIQKCMQRYEVGYDILRARRFKNMQEIGLLSKSFPLPRHDREYKNDYPKWDQLPKQQKRKWIREMATYAAMIEIMDDGIGMLIKELKSKGQFDNTLILFISDNGSTKEGGFISQLAAELSNTPFRQYKVSNYNGGIYSPMIVHWPEKLAKYSGELRHQSAHIIDIYPTLLAAARITSPTHFAGNSIAPPHGIDLTPAFGEHSIPHGPLFFEHQSRHAIIDDGWKLVSARANSPRRLYHLATDPYETTDLAPQNKDRVLKLESKWKEWAEANNVLPLGHPDWSPRIESNKRQFPDQDGIE